MRVHSLPVGAYLLTVSGEGREYHCQQYCVLPASTLHNTPLAMSIARGLTSKEYLPHNCSYEVLDCNWMPS